MTLSQRTRLTEQDIQANLPPGWELDAGRIWREWRFPTYQAGVDFVNRVARQAEERDHHPDLHLFHGLVRVAFWTHDVGGVTQADLKAAQAVNALAETGNS